MEKLGSRIKRLRMEKGVKQSFLHDNQSAVSQIERGFNENPSPELLRKVAENLEVTFEELVKGTSWSAPKDINSEGKYGYSELDFELTLSDAGEISIEHKRYPKYDSNGLENRFCPKTSTSLIYNCKSCKKPIQSNEQVFCMGCGKKIFQEPIYINMNECLIKLKVDDLFLEVGRIWSANEKPEMAADDIEWLYKSYKDQRKAVKTKKFFEVKNDNEWLKGIIGRLESLAYIENVYKGHSPKYIIEVSKVHGNDDTKLILQKFMDSEGNLNFKDAPVDLEEYIKGLKTENEDYYNFHLKLHYKMKFYELLAFNLTKLTSNNDNYNFAIEENEHDQN